MADAKNESDALGLYLTGAASDGGAQTNPAAALGNYRSSTEIKTRIGSVTTPIGRLRIDHIGGGNDLGAGTIRGDENNNLYWTPPGGTEGAAAFIPVGQSGLLIGGDTDCSLRISRPEAVAATGSMGLELFRPVNNLWAGDNIGNTERIPGENTYRAAMLYAHGDYPVTTIRAWIGTLGTQIASDAGQLGASGTGTITTTGSLADWPDTGWAHIRTSAGATREIVYYTSRTTTVLTISAAGHRGLLGSVAGAGAASDTVDAVPGIRIAEETAVSNQIQTIGSETTAPAAVSWNTSLTAAGGLAIAEIDKAGVHGLWVHREIPANAAASTRQENRIKFDFVAAKHGLNTTTLWPGVWPIIGPGGPPNWSRYEIDARGTYNIGNILIELYELYVGEDGDNPDFTASPDATSATLPFSYALTPPVAGTKEYRLTCRLRNRNNLVGLNQYARSFTIDDAGDLVVPDPSSPTSIVLRDMTGLQVRVTAKYHYTDDGDDAADTWAVYVTDTGTDPVPGVDVPETETMRLYGPHAGLNRALGPFAAEADVRVIVRALRSGDSADDGNTTVYQHDVTSGPDAPTYGDMF